MKKNNRLKHVILIVMLIEIVTYKNLFSQNYMKDEDIKFTSNKYIGIRGGYKITDFSGDILVSKGAPEKFKPMYLYNFGLLGLIMENNLGFRGEINYSPQGIVIESLNGSSTDKKEIIREYIEVPLMFNFSTSNQGSFFNPNFYLGPSIGFLLNANEKNHKNNTTQEQDVKSDYNSLDFGLKGGSSFHFKLTHRLIMSFDIKGYLGLSNINNVERDDINYVNTKNTSLTIGISLLYGN